MKLMPASVVVLAVAGCLIGGAPGVHAASEVKVVNTPDVSVPSPIPHSRLEVVEAELVAPGKRAPQFSVTLDATGFTTATISLAVEVQGTAGNRCMVTATLVPAEPFVRTAFLSHGIKLFPIETAVVVETSERIGIFGTLPIVQPLAFPKYDVYFSNASDRPVKVFLYVYLTS